MPELVEGLCCDWSLRLGATLHGGSSSYVAEAVTGDGQAAVLKVAMTAYEPIEGEVRTLQVAEGRGYARLLAADLSRAAMLTERLGGALSSEDLPIDVQMERICATLKRAWRPLPEPHGFATGVEKANWHIGFVQDNWEALGRPCPDWLIDAALKLSERRRAAFAPEASVLLHGDPHEENTLADPREPGAYRLVDPDGLYAEPAYDLSVMMRGWSEPLLAGDPLALGRARCHWLAALTGADPQAIWEWSVIERVSTGLLLTRLGDEPLARDMFAVAEAWAPSSA